MDLFSRLWAALRTVVADLRDEDFARASGCAGWLVRDLVCHLVIDAQDVLITLVTPAGTDPTRNAVTYWDVADALPSGDDPLDALIVRLAAAYEEPWLLKFHLDDVGAAAGRAAVLAEPPAEGLARSRAMLEEIAGAAFPASMSDRDALLVGTGRRAPSDAEQAELGAGLGARLPFVLGSAIDLGGRRTGGRVAIPG
jgi:Mycothiol maleylpyruvate isomerase N-terminal domain